MAIDSTVTFAGALAVAVAVGGGLLSGGCQSSWELRGRIDTSSIADRQHPLAIFVYLDPHPDGNGYPVVDDPTHAIALRVLDEVPADVATFSYARLGCDAAQVDVVAWSPHRSVPLPSKQSDGAMTFAPAPGDAIGHNGMLPIDPCSWWGTMQIDFALSQTAP